MSDDTTPATSEVVAAVETLHQAAEAAASVSAFQEARPNDVVVIAVKGIILTTVLALLGAVEVARWSRRRSKLR